MATEERSSKEYSEEEFLAIKFEEWKKRYDFLRELKRKEPEICDFLSFEDEDDDNLSYKASEKARLLSKASAKAKPSAKANPSAKAKPSPSAKAKPWASANTKAKKLDEYAEAFDIPDDPVHLWTMYISEITDPHSFPPLKGGKLENMCNQSLEDFNKGDQKKEHYKLHKIVKVNHMLAAGHVYYITFLAQRQSDTVPEEFQTQVFVKAPYMETQILMCRIKPDNTTSDVKEEEEEQEKKKDCQQLSSSELTLKNVRKDVEEEEEENKKKKKCQQLSSSELTQKNERKDEEQEKENCELW